MDPIHLFDLAAKQARYLSLSQSLIAANVSNASTPGYKAQVAEPFTEVLDQTHLSLASTNAAHLDAGAADQQGVSVKEETPWEVSDSGNSVSLEQEMIKAGDVNREYSINTGVVKAFHSMLMAAVKS